MKNKLMEIVQSSSLSEDNKKLWLVFVEHNGEKEIAPILKLLQKDENEKNLIFLTKNIKDKLASFLLNDQDGMNEIIKEEVAFLKEK